MHESFDSGQPGAAILGRGTACAVAPAVRGAVHRLESPDDVIALMDSDVDGGGVVAVIRDAGATFLAPVYDLLGAIVCLSGTPDSHIGIVAREYGIPCVMGADFGGAAPVDGATVTVDCSDAPAGTVLG